MKKPEVLQAELAVEMVKMAETADKVSSALAEMTALAADVPGQVAEIVARAASWDLDVRTHGEKISVRDPAGGILDLHMDQIYIGLGGGSVVAGQLYVNESHRIPNAASFREVTDLEYRALMDRMSSRLEVVVEAAQQIGR